MPCGFGDGESIPSVPTSRRRVRRWWRLRWGGGLRSVEVDTKPKWDVSILRVSYLSQGVHGLSRCDFLTFVHFMLSLIILIVSTGRIIFFMRTLYVSCSFPMGRYKTAQYLIALIGRSVFIIVYVFLDGGCLNVAWGFSVFTYTIVLCYRGSEKCFSWLWAIIQSWGEGVICGIMYAFLYRKGKVRHSFFSHWTLKIKSRWYETKFAKNRDLDAPERALNTS